MSPKSLPAPFCAFCLRERPQNVEFYKHVIGSSEEMRTSLQSLLGYEFNLENFAICKPCWKMVQLIQDFRLRCFKASEVVQRVTKGLPTAEDGWFTAKNLATIENVRLVVQDQMQQIEKINVTRRALVLDDSVEECVMQQGTEVDGEASKDLQFPNEGECLKTEMTKIVSTDNAQKIDSDFKCSICARIYMSMGDLERHYQCCSVDPTIYECKVCQKILPSNAALSEHLEQHPGRVTHRCTMFCDRRFNTIVDRAHHARFCTDGPRACKDCGEKCQNLKMLRAHTKAVHPDQPAYVCGTCGKRFRGSNSLRSHRSSCYGEGKRTEKLQSKEEVLVIENVLEE